MDFCVTLTTIPSRLKEINLTIESIKNQTLKPNKIFLNIPYKYKRFPNEKIDIEDLKKIESDYVEVTRCEDYGPATKFMGSLDKIKKYESVIILDDDHIYNNKVCEILINEFKKDKINYSFYLNKIFDIKMAQCSDGFLINTKFLDKVELFYEKFVKGNINMFLDDDLWVAIYLQKIKKTQIKNLIEKFRHITGKKVVYEIHSTKDALSHGVHKSGIFINRRKIHKIEYIKFMFKSLFIKC